MDPQQQQQMTSMVAGFGAAFLFISLLIYAFLVFLFWRIFSRAGMSGALGLIALFPGLGVLICLCILAFSTWRVAPIPPGYSGDMLPYSPQDLTASGYSPRPPNQL